MDYGNILEIIPHKLRYITIPLSLFIFAFIIRLSGGMWDTHVANDAYMSRQAEYIYSYGHPAVPDPFSSAPLYQPGMAYLLAFVGKLFDFIPTGMSSMTLAEGSIPPFLGAATVLVIFWLGSRFYNVKAGLLSGIFASVSFFLLFRTLKGFTFHNSLSLFLIALTIALVVKALDILQAIPNRQEKTVDLLILDVIACCFCWTYWLFMGRIFCYSCDTYSLRSTDYPTLSCN